MNKDDFLSKLTEILEADEEITYNTQLSNIDEWDSIAVISTAALLDSLGKKVTVDNLKNITTVKELAELAGISE